MALRLPKCVALFIGTVPPSVIEMNATKASNPAQLVDYLGMLFMHRQMPNDMRSALIDTITAIPATDLQGRAQVAVFLVVTSSHYKIMH